MKYYLPASLYRIFVLSTFLYIGFTLLAAPAFAAPASPKTVPTNIRADHLEYSADMQKVIFTGNVHVKREDFELFAHKATVLLRKAPTKVTQNQDDSEYANDMAPGEIYEIIATKDVVMINKQKEARAQRARYLVDQDRVTLEGGPPRPWLKDHENDRTVEGDILHYYINEGRSTGSNITMGFTAKDVSPPKK